MPARRIATPSRRGSARWAALCGLLGAGLLAACSGPGTTDTGIEESPFDVVDVADVAGDAMTSEHATDVPLVDGTDARDTLDAPDVTDAPRDTPVIDIVDEPACPGAMMLCAGICVDTTSDPLNCARCFNACPSMATCTAGACTCNPGLMPCGTECVDASRNDMNCGTCGHACPGGTMCSGGSCVACTASPHLATDVQPIFDSNCAVSGCHVGPFPASGLDLEASVSYAQLVGHTSTLCGADTRVVAGTPSASVIIFALTGVASSDGCSPPPMPFGMPPLPNSQIDLVRAWICSGAPNN